MTTYATDRLVITKRGEDRVVTVDDVELGVLFQTWTRLGGSGWTHDPKGTTHRTLVAAARPLIAAAVRSGRIVNTRKATR